MAMVILPAATLTFTLRDASGSKSMMEFKIPAATLKEAALAAADALRPLIAALTDAVIVGQSLSYSYSENAPAAPVAGSRVEEKGRFVFYTADGRTATIAIPAIKDSTLNTSGSINRSDLGITAFVTAVTAVDAIFCGASGSDITALKSAYQAFRSSTKSQLPVDR